MTLPLDLSPRHPVLLQPGPLSICLVGVGGTGSALAVALARLVWHAREQGLSVQLTLVDHDQVEHKNVGRQLFAPCEIEQNKAEAMAWRISAAFGLAVRAVAAPFRAAKEWLGDWNIPAYDKHNPHAARRGTVLLIGAVDNHHARRELAKMTQMGGGGIYWLDCGNAYRNGQVYIGNCCQPAAVRKIAVDPLGFCSAIPAPHLQEPALLQPDAAPDMDRATLSCAELAARGEQSLGINAMVAAIAAQYVEEWLVERIIRNTATYFSLSPATVRSDPITKQLISTWRSTKRRK